VPDIKCGYNYQFSWARYDNDKVTGEPAANLSKSKQMLHDYKNNMDWKKQRWNGKRRNKATASMAICYWLYFVMELMTRWFILFFSRNMLNFLGEM